MRKSEVKRLLQSEFMLSKKMAKARADEIAQSAVDVLVSFGIVQFSPEAEEKPKVLEAVAEPLVTTKQ